jgi:ubiquitin C
MQSPAGHSCWRSRFLSRQPLTLADYASRVSSILKLVLGPSCIYVKTLTGKTIEVDFGRISIVEDLKNELFVLEGIPADQQRLIFAGKQLEDCRSLAGKRSGLVLPAL